MTAFSIRKDFPVRRSVRDASGTGSLCRSASFGLRTKYPPASRPSDATRPMASQILETPPAGAAGVEVADGLRGSVVLTAGRGPPGRGLINLPMVVARRPKT